MPPKRFLGFWDNYLFPNPIMHLAKDTEMVAIVIHHYHKTHAHSNS